MSLGAVTPMLPVRHLPASIPFYEKLGFTVAIRNDQWGWARLALGKGELMLDQSINIRPDAPRQSVLYLYPDDIRAFDPGAGLPAGAGLRHAIDHAWAGPRSGHCPGWP